MVRNHRLTPPPERPIPAPPSSSLDSLVALSRPSRLQIPKKAKKLKRLKRLKRLKGEACGDSFIKATRLARLQEGDAGIGISRLQGYQGYWTGTHG